MIAVSRLSIWTTTLLVIMFAVGCAAPTARSGSPTAPPKAAASSESAAPSTTGAATSAATASGPARSAQAAERGAVSFAGKTLTLLVPYTAGGAADVHARQMSILL